MAEPSTPAPPREPAATAPPRPVFDRRRAWLITALIVAFMLINYADKSVLGLAAVPIMDELGISNSTYGMISSSFALLFSLSGLIVGFVSARVSSRVLLFTMAVVWAVAQLPVLIVASVPALVAGRVLLGAAEGPAASMSMHALYKWFPANLRGLPSALQISGAALGTLFAAPVVTWLITGFGWRSAFLVLAVTSVVWSLVWWRVGHDGPYGEDRVPGAHDDTSRDCDRDRDRNGDGDGDRDGDGGGNPDRDGAPDRDGDRGRERALTPASAPRERLPYRRLLLNGTVLGSIAGAFGASWALALSHAWLPVYLRTQLDLTPGAAAGLISAISGFSLVLLLSVPPLVDRLRRRGRSARWSTGAPQGIAVVLAAVAMATFPFVDGTAPHLVLLALAFGGHAIVFPLHYMTASAVVPPRQRGAVFGVVAATGTLPGLVAPYLTGRLLDSADSAGTGYTHAFLLSAAVMLVCGLLALAAIRPERDARRLGPAVPAEAPRANAPQADGSKPLAQ
ncbi:MFS transporter [Streptomyces sp. SID10362]|uniref:MFS transporter n=1 Tax=Streptomyces sp. SID10362 TaxID=2706021 RepID=UPI0013CA1286|nr:MFS transporter [Streptomyces sp. SID10362]NDZ69837.1 MFS transporter [Streptomyces sp. SID10362]